MPGRSFGVLSDYVKHPVSFVVGLGLLIHSTFQPSSMAMEVRLGPALVALGFAVLFWGLVTVENVLQLVAAVRGRSNS